VLATFLLTCIAWVFFRAQSLSDAWLVLRRMAGEYGPLFTAGTRDFVHGVVAIALQLVFDYATRGQHFESAVLTRPAAVRWSVYLLLASLIGTMGVFSASQFIYFQF